MEEKHFLDDFIHSLDKEAKLGSHKDQQAIWYNKAGDCLEFQTVDEPFVAHRVDKYLTLYRSAETNQLIGFKIKDVKALIKKYCFDAMVVGAGVQDKRIISIIALLVNVLAQDDPTIKRREGYTEALRSVPKEAEKVTIPV